VNILQNKPAGAFVTQRISRHLTFDLSQFESTLDRRIAIFDGLSIEANDKASALPLVQTLPAFKMGLNIILDHQVIEPLRKVTFLLGWRCFFRGIALWPRRC
jgi:hypothetical protein